MIHQAVATQETSSARIMGHCEGRDGMYLFIETAHSNTASCCLASFSGGKDVDGGGRVRVC